MGLGGNLAININAYLDTYESETRPYKARLWKRAILIALIGFIALACIPYPQPAHAAPGDSNRCISIASDSNGFGQVTFQIPPDGDVGIIFVRPLAVVLQDELHKAGRDDLQVIDRSLSASGLTASGRTNYLKSIPYGNLINDRCQYIMVGPFIPDVAAGQATPEDYTGQMAALVAGLLDKNPTGIIFILSHYQTERADFTANNNGFGMHKDRIDAFNAKFADSCRPDGSLGRYRQVICIDTQAQFAGMGDSYLLTGATQAQFQALVYRPTGFRPKVEAFFQANPGATITGDGIHLSLAGRTRLMQRLVQWVNDFTDF